MNLISYCKTISGETIEIYDVHFCYPNDRFATYWVAVLQKYQPCNNVKGFLIDGKRLCFRDSKNNFHDIDMLTNGLEWLQKLRNISG